MKRRALSGIFQVFCIILGILLMLPLIYCIICSFMEETEIVSSELNLWPKVLYLGNYITVITKTKMFRFMFNSFVVAILSGVGRVITSCTAAYAFSFMNFRGKNFLFLLVLGTMVIPAEMLMVQNYFTTAEMGLINTYAGMVIIYLVSGANIFLMRQNFMDYSRSVREAALVDGCGDWKFFWRILIPTSRSAIATVFITSFVASWNTYLWPFMVTNIEEMRTAQVIITMLNDFAIVSAYGQVMAASVLLLIPSIFVFVLFRREISTGLMTGAVKE